MPLTAEEQAEKDAAEKLELDEAEKAKAEEAQAEADFAAGYEGVSAEKVELTPEELKAKEDAEKAEAEAKAAEEAEEAKKAELAKPLTAQDQLFLDLVKKANSVDEVHALLSKVRDQTNGRIGSIEQTLRAMQEATPSGQTVEVTDADFAELVKELPDIAPSVITGLKRVMGKMKGSAPAPVVTETPEQFEARVNAVADKRIASALDAKDKKAAVDALAQKHQDWNTIIGPADSQTEFRQWLSTQPHAYAETFLASWDPAVVSEGLDKFKAMKTPKPKVEQPKPKVETPQSSRAQRLAEAVPARGGAAVPAKPGKKTAEEEFEEGFKS